MNNDEVIINIIATGLQGSGKTRLLNHFIASLPEYSRVLAIKTHDEEISNQSNITLLLRILK